MSWQDWKGAEAAAYAEADRHPAGSAERKAALARAAEAALKFRRAEERKAAAADPMAPPEPPSGPPPLSIPRPRGSKRPVRRFGKGVRFLP